MLVSCSYLAAGSGEPVHPRDAVLVEVVVHQRALVDPPGICYPRAPVSWLARLCAKGAGRRTRGCQCLSFEKATDAKGKDMVNGRSRLVAQRQPMPQ